MRFGLWRGVMLALTLCSAAVLTTSSSARADLFHTIPRSAPAVDVTTGQPMYAPPVPYGCYAKDPIGCIHSAFGCIHCRLAGLCGGLGCGGNGCGGGGCGGHGLCGHGGCGGMDPGCGGGGCGLGGHGLFHRHGKGCGLCGGVGCGLCSSPALNIEPATKTLPSSQACIQCGGAGCGLCKKLGHHGLKQACGNCGGGGCGLCRGGMFHGNACGNCGGAGCGLCKGGLFHGKGCNNCGGAGCGLCKGGLPGAGALHGLIGSVLHRNRVKYFVGAGGPVPITPGYVPYVVPVRSPRDYFAFPPFSPDIP